MLGLKRGVGPGTCNQIREAVIVTPNTSFRGLFYDPLPDGVFTPRAVTALNEARQTCATVATWQTEDTLAQQTGSIEAILRTTMDDAAAESWLAFAAPLPPQLMLSELRDYIWIDNAQQRADVLKRVADRLGAEGEATPPPELDRVRVMTMHGAKGLSGRVVFIPGLEHGLLPNRHQTPYPAQLLEAARLLYVSITRARAACVLSFAQRRTIFGTFQTQHPSQFAGQTGGTFAPRTDSLTADETTAIMDLVNDL